MDADDGQERGRRRPRARATGAAERSASNGADAPVNPASGSSNPTFERDTSLGLVTEPALDRLSQTGAAGIESWLASDFFDFISERAISQHFLSERELDRLTDAMASGTLTDTAVLERWRSEPWWERVVPPSETVTCRICPEECGVSALIAPCDCTGSARFVHPQCLVRWQQRGHLHMCEVCHAPWKHGLDPQTAEPESEEAAADIAAACAEAVRVDDAGALRRRLSAHMAHEHGSALLVLAASLGHLDSLRELLDAGANPSNARMRAVSLERDYDAARLLTTFCSLPPPDATLPPGEGLSSVLEVGERHLNDDGSLNGDTSRVLMCVVAGSADGVRAAPPRYPTLGVRAVDDLAAVCSRQIRTLWAGGVDINAPEHRCGRCRISPLQNAIECPMCPHVRR